MEKKNIVPFPIHRVRSDMHDENEWTRDANQVLVIMAVRQWALYTARFRKKKRVKENLSHCMRILVFESKRQNQQLLMEMSARQVSWIDFHRIRLSLCVQCSKAVSNMHRNGREEWNVGVIGLEMWSYQEV